MSSPPRHAALTIASRRYLANARATARSFREHNPATPFFVILADEDPEGLAREDDAYQLIPVAELPLPQPDSFRFKYSELEFTYALTPFAIAHVLAQGFDGVMFLKQETLVLGPLGPVFAGLDRHTALLTPHFLHPPERVDALTWELNVLLAGVFNGGVSLFDSSQESRRFLQWWGDKTFTVCLRDVENGLHFEQRWLDFVPSLMPGYGQIRDPGINVGHWNLPDRRIRIRNGRVLAGDRPCRIFRFSGYNPATPDRVTQYNQDYLVAHTGDAAEVFARYQSLLETADYAGWQAQTYAFDNYEDGTPISAAERRAYLQLGPRAAAFGNPFRRHEGLDFHLWAGARNRTSSA